MAEKPFERANKYVVASGDAGGRLDRVTATWRGLSRAAVLRLIEAGGLKLNARAVKLQDKGRLLCLGDTLEIELTFDQPESPKPDPQMPLEILHQCPGWLAVNKPAGIDVRPHALGEIGTVLNAVTARYPQVIGVGEGGLRCGVVHRLDQDTSGVLVVAIEQQAWLGLRRAFKDHQVKKRYFALVHGIPAEAGRAAAHLRVARHKPAHVEVLDRPAPERGTRDCSLAWRVLEVFGSLGSLIEVDLHTGFLHQVRAMMSSLGHPLVGDTQYGGERETYTATRHMLHAASLEIDDVTIEASVPSDFVEVKQAMRDFV